jgi:hypothetical protein
MIGYRVGTRRFQATGSPDSTCAAPRLEVDVVRVGVGLESGLRVGRVDVPEQPRFSAAGRILKGKL